MNTENKLVFFGALAIIAAIIGGYLYVNLLISSVGHGQPQEHSSASKVVITTSTTEGKGPLTVSFRAPSMIGDSHPSYRWDFGDGNSERGTMVSHTFQKPGSYIVTVTAILDDGTEQKGTITIKVQA